MGRFWWRRPREVCHADWETLVDDVRCVVDGLQERGVALAGFLGLGRPLVTGETICFNGARPCWGESFVFARVFGRDGSGASVWDSCDTFGHPYEAVVLCVLGLVKRHLGDGVDLAFTPPSDDALQNLAGHQRLELITQPPCLVVGRGRSRPFARQGGV